MYVCYTFCVVLPHSCSCRESCLLELLIGSLGAGIKQPSHIRFLFRVLALVMFIGVGSVDVDACQQQLSYTHKPTYTHTCVSYHSDSDLTQQPASVWRHLLKSVILASRENSVSRSRSAGIKNSANTARETQTA